jgi:hypothetical protein
VLAGAALMIAAAGAPADAQVIPTRPFPGLFGSGDPAKSVTQVDFTSFIAAGHESTTTSADDGALGSSNTDSTFGNLVFRGRLAHQGRRTTFGASGGATTSYVSAAGDMTPFNLSAGADFGGALGRYSSFALRQSVFYSPFYVYGVASADASDASEPGEPQTTDSDPSVDPRVDQRVTRLATMGYNTFASVNRKAGKDGAFFASYRFNYTDYSTRAFDFVSHAPRAGYRKKISRFGSVIASYGLQAFEYRGADYPWLISHNVALGLGYDRPLSAWRRTTVGFNVSTALIGDGRFLSAHLNGNAHLARRFGRTWITGVTYVRGQQVLEGFAVPFFTFSDTVAATFFGRIVRDIGLSGRVSYSHSRFTLQALRNQGDTFYASSRVQVPVMWALAFYLEGYYSDHDFQRRLGLLEGIPTSIDRLGMRAGLTVSVPVYR